ncbi:MAG: hypothetical protein SZ59_C0002G0284 [candidate division TM6 bacterium GW2011_GWF2_28_16]|nr:MAG: hypothetical protein SZ59_C0002G0284 [candidate division TM6 bacterium GW2011_GWF2_28_16]
MFNKNKKFLFFIFIFSFIIRFLFFNFLVKDSPVLWEFDSKVYKQVAQKIIEDKQISNQDDSPHFYRVPGYSIFLALTSLNNNLNNSLLLQILLSSLIPILIFYLALIIYPESFLLAKLAAIFSCINIGFMTFSGLAMTESLFLILFLVFLILFYKNKLFLSGIILGLSSMFRPVGHYLIFIIIFLILLNFKNKLKNIIYIFSGWFIAVLPLLLRNFLLTGCLFFTTLPGIHFIKHGAARICMQANNCDYMCALNKVNNEWECEINKKIKKNINLNKKLSEPEICNLGEKIALNYFVKYPYLTIKLAIKNILKTCFSLYSSEIIFLDTGVLPEYEINNNFFYNIKKLFKKFLVPEVNNEFIVFIVYLEIILNIFLIIGFLGFAFKSIHLIDYKNIFLKLILFIFLFIFLSFSCGFARLRLPIEPILILLSLKFWVDIFYKKKRNYG